MLISKQASGIDGRLEQRESSLIVNLEMMKRSKLHSMNLRYLDLLRWIHKVLLIATDFCLGPMTSSIDEADRKIHFAGR
jgi:hypothetical protein